MSHNIIDHKGNPKITSGSANSGTVGGIGRAGGESEVIASRAVQMACGPHPVFDGADR